MNSSLRTKLVYASLPIALIWAATNYSPDKKTAGTSKPARPVIQTVPKATGAVDARLIDIEKEFSKPWGADPFRTTAISPQVKPPVQKIQWFLSGIVYSKDNPLAFINKRSVRIGEVVDQARVVAIQRKSVIIDYKGQRLTLTVKKG